jgi:hypothetical protein
MLKLKQPNTSYMQGILVSGVAYYMQVWVIDKSGPVFLSMTMPITLLVTIMLSSFVLGEDVTVGRCYSFCFTICPFPFAKTTCFTIVEDPEIWLLFACSILGGAIMVGGLYCVLWAKATEQVDDKRLQVSAPVRETEV